jgi:hypothetical protein
MTDIAQVTTPTLEDLKKLYELQEQLATLKSAEAMLRRRIADHFFPAPTEGSAENKYPLAQLGDNTGAILQMDHKINRTVLEPELAVLKAKIEEAKTTDAPLPKLPFNKLVKYKPEVVTAEYRKLTAEERKLFDEALNIKPGMPEVKIVIPKRG